MAGTLNISLSQQFDSTGAPLKDGNLYFYAAGTTTPQSAYQDSALTLPWPNPIPLDAAGRVPAFFLADGQIKIRLANSAGVTQVAADNLLVIGASSGAGSPPTVDATTVLQTGDLKVRYGTGVHTGWVRSNGRTIGSSTSVASERANSDTQTLFEYLWAADANLSVSTGRGASANADWVANKTIALPDWRGRMLAGLDDMGSSAAGRITATYFGGNTPTVLGIAAGVQTAALSTTNLPAYTPAGTITNGAISFPAAATTQTAGSGATGVVLGASGGGSNLTTILNPSQASTTILGTAQGGLSTPFSLMPPTMLATIYIKL